MKRAGALPLLRAIDRGLPTAASRVYAQLAAPTDDASAFTCVAASVCVETPDVLAASWTRTAS
ncbi:MAG: hypothetical protein IT380_25515 [Myxococcales bacterium]|nr:hypothetical protein [Myxococcales bacterium]